MQELVLGVLKKGIGLESILGQLGLNWTICLGRGIGLEKFPALIVNKNVSGQERKQVGSYLQSGGCALTYAGFAESIDPAIKLREQLIRFIEPRGKLFSGTGVLWLQQKGFLIVGAKQGLVNGKQPAILLKRIGRGLLIVLPFDPEGAFLDQRSGQRWFCSEKASLPETVSVVSKGNLSRLLFNCVLKMFEHRGLPLVHKWFYPMDYRSAFAFHVDVDNYGEEDIGKTKRVVGGKAVWFVNAEAIEKESASLQLLQGEKIGSHNYCHKLFEGMEENLENVSRAHGFFEKNGIRAKGFSAPNGEWNSGLAKALEQIGYDYAVGFGLGYDCLPFHPVVDGKRARLLLVGTHPICIGILKTRDFNEGEMIAYFQAVLERNLAAGLPLFFYGHPLKRIARFPKVVWALFKTVAGKNKVWKTDVEEFALWWRRREKKRFRAFFEKKKLVIETGNNEREFSLRVLFSGFEGIVAMQAKEVSLEKLAGLRKAKHFTLNDTTAKTSPIGKKFFVKQLLGKAGNRIST